MPEQQLYVHLQVYVSAHASGLLHFVALLLYFRFLCLASRFSSRVIHGWLNRTVDIFDWINLSMALCNVFFVTTTTRQY